MSKKSTIKARRTLLPASQKGPRTHHDNKEGGPRVRYLIVHNSQSGFGSDAIFEFERFLVRQRDECVLRVLPETGGADEAVADADDFDVVVASGGDGTVASLLYALRGCTTPVCVFPSGTANLLVTNLGNAMEPRALARACHDGRWASTDLGQIGWEDEGGQHHERGFVIMAGIGFDAQIMRSALPNKRDMGEAAYFAAVLSNMHPKVTHFTIDCDGVRYERDGIACVACNTAMMQGGIELIPNTRMDDGLLDLMVIRTTETVGLIRPMFAGLLDRAGKRLDRPHLEHLCGSAITVRSADPLPIQADGEAAPGTGTFGFTARVLPGCNRLIVDGGSSYAPAPASAAAR